MSKKSTAVYTVDILVHLSLTEGVDFKRMQQIVKDVKEYIEDITRVPGVPTATIEKTIIQKRVTY